MVDGLLRHIAEQVLDIVQYGHQGALNVARVLGLLLGDVLVQPGPPFGRFENLPLIAHYSCASCGRMPIGTRA